MHQPQPRETSCSCPSDLYGFRFGLLADAIRAGVDLDAAEAAAERSGVDLFRLLARMLSAPGAGRGGEGVPIG